MRICFLCHEYPPYPTGGIGTVVQQLARYMVRRGHNVHVTGVYRGLEGIEEDVDEGVRIWRVPWYDNAPKAKLRDLLSRWRLRCQVQLLVREYAIDILDGVDQWGSLLLMPSTVKRICRIHDSTVLGAMARMDSLSWAQRLYVLAGRFADHFAAVSDPIAESAKRYWRTASRHPITVLPNPVNPEFFTETRWSKKNKHVVFTGTLNSNKGVPELIKAWLTLKDEWPDHSLHLYGKSGESSRMVEDVSATPHNKITWHGAVSQASLINAYKQAYCAVFPSHNEADGVAMREAAATGTPIIASDISAFREGVTKTGSVTLHSPGDVQGLADAIRILMSDPIRAEKAAKSGCEIAKSRHIDVLGPLNEAYYENLLSGVAH